MALIVVVASQVCAHVQTPQFMYIKYVLFCAYHITPQDVFFKYANTTSSCQHNSQTIHTYTQKKSTTHTKNHV